MSQSLSRRRNAIAREIAALDREVSEFIAGRANLGNKYERYRLDPVGYFHDVLHYTLTPDQTAIAVACLEPPYRILVESGHNVGKSLLLAGLICWWYDTRNPGTCLFTAGGNLNTVKDIVWAEVRIARTRAELPDDFTGPVAPHLQTGPEHWAKGITSATGEGFQGRHRQHAMFAFDEAEDVPKFYWDAGDTMFVADGTNLFIAALNPLTTTSEAYQQSQMVDAEGNPKWRRFAISSLDHPNIAVGLANRAKPAGVPPDPLPVPAAVKIEQINDWLAQWFESIPADEYDEETDIEWPPGSGKYLRPDPDGEARVLGRRPTSGSNGVWSEKVFDLACKAALVVPIEVPQLGCDVARYGFDRTEIHARCGPCSLAHEDHGGWDTVRTSERLETMVIELADWHNQRIDRNAKRIEPGAIPIKVDDTGVGGGVTDQLRARRLNAIAVNSGERAPMSDKYPLIRDQLWFALRLMAKNGRLDLSRLPGKVRARLKVQALAPTWNPTPDRRRRVESKEDVKKRLGRSPDGMDSVNLAYYETGGYGATILDMRK